MNEPKKKEFGVTRERFAPSKKSKRATSDSLSANAKQFLDKIDIKVEELKTPTMKIVDSLKAFSLPNRGEQHRIRTQAQLNLISLVMKIVHKHDFIKELTIATYTLNKEAFAALRKLLKSGKIKKLNLLLASAYSFREPVYFNFLKNTCLKLSEKYALSLVFAWAHFKITLARCDDDFYQFEGSMNYSTNNMAEQILLCNSREIYEYDYNFIMGLREKTGNKALEIIC